MTDQSQHRWLGGTLAVFLALVQFRVIAFILQQDYGRSVFASLGIVDGHPAWRLFQSRVLGPYLVLGLSYLLPSFPLAHVAYSIVAVAVAGYLAFRLGRVHGGDLKSALLTLILFEATFSYLLSQPWLYSWDYIEIIAFFVFVDFVLAARSWRWFAGLYLVAIFAHDYAQFIALWLVLDPLCRWGLGRLKRTPAAPLDRAKLIAGLVLLPLGMAILESLRRTLMIQEMGPINFTDLGNRPPDGTLFGIALFDNLRGAMGALLAIGNLSMPLVVPLFWILAVALAARLAWRFPIPLLGLALTYGAMAAAELMFAQLFETRTLVAFIPLVVGATLLLCGRDTGWAAQHPSPTLGDLWRRRGAATVQ
jgi:hypothetical protein